MLNKKNVMVVRDENNNAYVHGKQMCCALEYKDYRDAIRTRISEDDVKYLKNICPEYKSKKMQLNGQTKFISEQGLYSLILNSKQKSADEFKKIIINKLPQLN